MKKTKILWYLLDSIFLIVFNIYFFLLKGVDHHSSIWISYVSIHVAYFMLLTTPFLVRKRSRSTDYGRPLFSISTSYFFLALIVGIVFILDSPENNTVTLLVQITIAALYAILLLTNLIANEHTADSNEKHEFELKYVKESSSRLEALIKQISDSSVRKKVEMTYDLIHSSQVKSSITVESLEQDVISEIDNLEIALKQNNLEKIQLAIDKMLKLANERNQKLKLLN